MTHDQIAELTMLMHDPKTFISLQTNATEDGRRILNGSASVRHDSQYRDTFLNPARSYHDLPHDIVRSLEWVAWPVKGQPLGSRYKAHDTAALIFACGFTIRELTMQTPPRGNVDIPSSGGETMAREVNSYEAMLASFDEDELTEEDLDGFFEEDDELSEDDLLAFISEDD